ncbi:MAG TPA: serine hydrolase domain-containing protein, partial [Candidatus Binatia bacterium]|nr:serine hydrolase domain-containing protein [Candidatus Binatia bacterium]
MKIDLCRDRGTRLSLLLFPALAISCAACVLSSAESSVGSSSKSAAATPVRLGNVDSIIQQAIADKNIPGAVLVVGHDGKVIYRKAYGERSLEPRREPMTLDTIFDLASLTKVIATTTSVMQLVELGKVRLNDPVAKYLPEFAQNGKEDITVRQLLTHYSGLAPDL